MCKDAATEITNFAATAWSLELIDAYYEEDMMDYETIKNLSTYGPAITENDSDYQLPGESMDDYLGRMETRADRAAWYDQDR